MEVFGHAEEELMEVDPVVLRTPIHERTHHTIEALIHRIMAGRMGVPPTRARRLRTNKYFYPMLNNKVETSEIISGRASMGKLNVAVVGCGSWGRNHARVYNDLPDASLLAVVDVDENNAREIGERYRVDWYTDPEKIFSSPDVEAVSICTPTIFGDIG